VREALAAVVSSPIPVTHEENYVDLRRRIRGRPWYPQAAFGDFIVHQLDDLLAGTDASPEHPMARSRTRSTNRASLEAHVRLQQVATDLAQRVSYYRFPTAPRDLSRFNTPVSCSKGRKHKRSKLNGEYVNPSGGLILAAVAVCPVVPSR